MIDKKSLKMLKYIKKNANISLDELKNKFGDCTNDHIGFLHNNEYIINEIKGYLPCINGQMPIRKDKFRISPKGLAYLQELKIERRKYWFPVVLSNIMAAAALAVSIIALLQ